jgi:hypothetical protein
MSLQTSFFVNVTEKDCLELNKLFNEKTVVFLIPYTQPVPEDILFELFFATLEIVSNKINDDNNIPVKVFLDNSNEFYLPIKERFDRRNNQYLKYCFLSNNIDSIKEYKMINSCLCDHSEEKKKSFMEKILYNK